MFIMLTRKISVRDCAEAHDIIRLLERVKPMPKELSDMPEEKGGEIMKKIKTIFKSGYYSHLPNQRNNFLKRRITKRIKNII